MSRRKDTEKLPFGKLLRELMHERALTIRAIAEMAGVSTSVAQGWVQGASPANLPAVARLAQALGISFKGLLLGEPETQTQALSDLFEEQEILSGHCKVQISRLVPKKG